VTSQAQTKLAAGVPFVSDKDLNAALDKAGVPKDQAKAITDENAKARIDGLRSALSVLALLALLAAVFTFRLPTRQPASEPET
jgi:hypothetical protein